jgi:hypothetical protein
MVRRSTHLRHGLTIHPMRAMRAFAAGTLVVAAACTGTSAPTAQPAPSVSTTASTATGSPTVVPTSASAGPTAMGAALPDGCDGTTPRPSQTVAFVADGRAWAMNPASGLLTCMFETRDPGPFAWGPQGDRVLLGDMQLRFLDGSVAAIGAAPASVFDWGRPIGKAVVYRAPHETRKYVLEDESIEDLPTLPIGTYQQIAYHPGGLALAIADTSPRGKPEIYVSTNEGERPDRIVVGISATRFTSVDFTSDGRFLLYLADHKGGYAQLHMIDLEDPTELMNLWKSEEGVTASGLQLPPGIGDTRAFTTGATCEEAQAVLGSVDAVAPAVPDEDRPTRAIGYLDDRRLLVAAGGCGAPTDLYVVTESGAALVATQVDTAAARSNGPDDAVPLPEELLGDVQEFG